MKLTATHREAIRAYALASLDEQKKALAAEQQAVALAVYEAIFPKKQRDMAAALYALNKKWFRTSTVLYVNAAGERHHLHLYSERPMPSHDEYVLTWDAHRELVERVRKYASDANDFSKRRHEVDKEITILLRQARTQEQLLRVWPEGKQFFSTPPLQKEQLPAANTVRLNELLGLTKAA